MIKDLKDYIDSAFPKGYPVVFLHAHPDDESFLSAGIMQELMKRERECILVYGAAALVGTQQKTIQRQIEAMKAVQTLGLSKILYLNYCEPQYKEKGGHPLYLQNPKDTALELKTLLFQNKINKPIILISYDENGGYGNQDHKTIHTIGREFIKVDNFTAPILYELTLNREHANDWLNSAKTRLSVDSLPDLSYWSKEFGLPSSVITYKFALSKSQTTIKRRALSNHHSQMDKNQFPLSLSKEDFTIFFGTEWLYEVIYTPYGFYEIEKKFLIQKLPFDLSKYNSVKIIQGYLSIKDNGDEERIRSKNGIYTLTSMKGNGLIRSGNEVEISEEEFQSLWPRTKGKRIKKTRYTIPYNKLSIEIDIYHDALDGLITAEVEFQSEKSANEFTPPSWIGTDVTGDKKYKNQSLAQ